MADRPRLLALVPARGGSKRLPGKNLLPLGGMPLIAWSIRTALACEAFVDVLASTDDPGIAAAARSAGATVPWLRPADLASDTASSADVMRHALAWHVAEHGPVDGLVLLQPTSPFRSVATVHRGIDAFVRHGRVCVVVAVSPAVPHPDWCFTVENGTLHPIGGWNRVHSRSQDLRPAYAVNGALYLLPAAPLLAGDPWLTPSARALIVDDAEEAHDIDTPLDWDIAQAIAARRATGDTA